MTPDTDRSQLAIKNRSQAEGGGFDTAAKRYLEEKATIVNLVDIHGVPRETAERMVHPPSGPGFGYKSESF